MKMWILKIGLCLLICRVCDVECLVRISFPIGGLFYDETQAAAFRLALNKRTSENLRFEAQYFTPSSADIYTTLREVCKRTSTKDQNHSAGFVVLVDAGETAGTCNALCQLCGKVQVPQLLISWRPPEPFKQSKSPFGLSYYPQPSLISGAYATLIKYLDWPSFTILYEDGGGLVRMQEIIKSRPPTAEPIIFRKLDPNGDNKILFKSLINGTYFVVDCDVDNILYYLEEISTVNNHTMYQSYIFTSLDAHTVDPREVPKFEGNFSTLHMTDKEETFWLDTNFNSRIVKLQTALAVDAATHATMALESIMSKNPNFTQPTPICYSSDKQYQPWEHGSVILNEMRETKMTHGLTGYIDFGNSSYRKNIILKYSKHTNNGFILFGFWNSSTNALNLRSDVNENDQYQQFHSTKKIRVISKITKPYFGVNNETGKYEGFAVDLIDKIFEQINKNLTDGSRYDYEFYEANQTDHIKEMIDDLQHRNADLAICDFTITSERQELVDFSSPFMNLGISILFLKSPKEEPNKFSFLEPLTLGLWLYLGTAYIFVSLVLLICARMSQEDWVNPHPCNRNPEALENIWTLYNCTWLSMGTIMTQGCDILPRAPGSRWVTGMWWFFALIITASYTANISSFVSANISNKEITSVKQLAEQNKIQYGTVAGKSTYKFFEKSNDSLYKKIFSTMESTKPSVYMSDNELGKQRVLSGKNKYAFFMESTTIEYYTNRNCNLTTFVGGRLDSKDYGIAMPKNSPLRSKIDNAILSLQEESVIQKIKKLWWEEKDNTERCKDKEEEGKSEDAGEGSLQMNSTSGIFLVLLAGSLLGLTFAASEFILHAHKIATVEKITWREAIRSEWRSSLNPRVLSKPVAPPRTASPSPSSEGTPSLRRRSTSRAVSVLKAAQSFINLEDVY